MPMTYPHTCHVETLGKSKLLAELNRKLFDAAGMADYFYACRMWSDAEKEGRKVAELVEAIEREDRRCRGWGEEV